MLEEVRLLDEIDSAMYQYLWRNLTGITDHELDWQPHPHANSVRWVLGHMIWNEEWVPDAVQGTGRYGQDTGPVAYRIDDLREIRECFAHARARYQAMLETLTPEDLAREVDYFGSPYTVRKVLITHTTHLTGSRYQIRYIRGTYSRAHETDKAVFDPW